MTTNSTRAIHFLVAAVVILLDRWTKHAVASHIALYAHIQIIPGFFRLTHTENTGAAFSLFATMPAGFRHVFFIVLSIVATVVLIALMARRTTTMLSSIAFALVLGGTVGNLIDRLTRGLVVDFIYFHHASFSYPVFNIADSAITVGVAMILLLSWLDAR